MTDLIYIIQSVVYPWKTLYQDFCKNKRKKGSLLYLPKYSTTHVHSTRHGKEELTRRYKRKSFDSSSRVTYDFPYVRKRESPDFVTNCGDILGVDTERDHILNRFFLIFLFLSKHTTKRKKRSGEDEVRQDSPLFFAPHKRNLETSYVQYIHTQNLFLFPFTFRTDDHPQQWVPTLLLLMYSRKRKYAGEKGNLLGLFYGHCFVTRMYTILSPDR